MLDLQNIRKTDIAQVGGKAANLGELLAAGIEVPPGFVVTAAEYRAFLEENSIDITRPDVGEKIRAGHFSPAFREELHRRYRGGRVAVRSSATTEDLADASFAGQQETYLNVCGEVRLEQRIRDCFASLWSQRALEYRKHSGYEHADIAVVIQEMVESEVAGVLFTVDPLRHDGLLINAAYGLGESVVSGRVNADSYSV